MRRDGSDTRALKAALALLRKAARSWCSRRARGGWKGEPLRDGQPGVGMLAVLSGAPVVPVYVSGSGAALPRGRALPRPGRVRVTFGPRDEHQSGRARERVTKGRKEAYREAAQEMMRAIAQLREQQGRA